MRGFLLVWKDLTRPWKVIFFPAFLHIRNEILISGQCFDDGPLRGVLSFWFWSYGNCKVDKLVEF